MRIQRKRSFGESDRNSQHSQPEVLPSQPNTTLPSNSGNSYIKNPYANDHQFNSENHQSYIEDRYGSWRGEDEALQVVQPTPVYMQTMQTAPIVKTKPPPGSGTGGYVPSKYSRSREERGASVQRHTSDVMNRSQQSHNNSNSFSHSRDMYASHRSSSGLRPVDHSETVRWGRDNRTSSAPPNRYGANSRDVRDDAVFKQPLPPPPGHRGYSKPPYPSEQSHQSGFHGKQAPARQVSTKPPLSSHHAPARPQNAAELRACLLRSPGYTNSDLCTEL